MNEFIITVKEEVIRERYATKEEILLCKKSILRDKIDEIIMNEQLEETGDKIQKLLMEEVSEEDIRKRMEKMVFNEIDFEVQDEVSSEIINVEVNIGEDMWD